MPSRNEAVAAAGAERSTLYVAIEMALLQSPAGW